MLAVRRAAAPGRLDPSTAPRRAVARSRALVCCRAAKKGGEAEVLRSQVAAARAEGEAATARAEAQVATARAEAQVATARAEAQAAIARAEAQAAIARAEAEVTTARAETAIQGLRNKLLLANDQILRARGQLHMRGLVGA